MRGWRPGSSAHLPGRGRAWNAPRMRSSLLSALALLAACATTGAPKLDLELLARQVGDTERAFAKTMADRDHAAFATFLSEEAVFFSGPRPLHGKEEVAGYWRRFFEKPAAPFSWEPAQVEVLPSGQLALTTGPVRDPGGKCIASFTSVWRLEGPGRWRILFDKGCDGCPAP